MDEITEQLLRFVSSEDNLAGLGALAGAAGIEYVFPPFPGDAITLLGAVLVTGYGWSFFLVFLAVMLGSVGGSMIAFWIGRRLGARRLRRKLEQDRMAERGVLDAMIERFHRHGPAFLIVNRFVPGLRAIALVAAGMAGMRSRAVLLYAAISSALYNLALMGVGAALGANLDELRAFVSTYTTWALVIVVVVALAIGATVWWRRRRRPAPPAG
jgi:membrane protein DedA with SNARE-associated domain